MFLLYEDPQDHQCSSRSLDLFPGRNISTTGVALDAMAELETVLTRRLEEVEAKGASYTKAFGGYGKVVNQCD